MPKSSSTGSGRPKKASGTRKPAAKPAAKKTAAEEGEREAGPEEGREGGQLHRDRHHRARGPRGRPQAARHVHRLDRLARPPPPRLRGRRQLRRRGDRRPLLEGLGHAAPRQQRHRRRRRARDPGRHAQEGEAPRGRGRADHPARRRQVRRRRRLQGLRRAARRRRLGRQRALRGAPPRDPPRRPRLEPGLRPRRSEGQAQEGQGGQEQRDDDHLQARPRHLRGGRVRLRDALRALARDRLPDPRAQGRADRRARRRRAGRVPIQGRDRRLRQAPERDQGPAAQEDHLLRRRDRRRPGRDRDAVERLLSGVDLQLRQQHQYPRGRHPPLGLQARR